MVLLDPLADLVGHLPHPVADGQDGPGRPRQRRRHVRDALLAGQPLPVGVQRVAAQFRPGSHRPDVGLHPPLGREQLLRFQRPVDRRAGSQQLDPRPGAGGRRRPEAVDAPQDPLLDRRPVGYGRLPLRLVVHRQVVEDVLGPVAVHAPQPLPDDHRDLEGERGVVADGSGVRGRQQVRVPVGVLQALTGHRRASRGRADHEAAPQLVCQRPELVARPLEAEHRVEDVERDHGLAVRGVRGRGGRELRQRPGRRGAAGAAAAAGARRAGRPDGAAGVTCGRGRPLHLL